MRALFVCLLLFLCGPVQAGLIYGSLSQNAQPLQQQPLSINCTGSPRVFPGVTNENGSYSINVSVEGRCELAMNFNREEVRFTVFSERNPSRNDLELVNENNRWILRRK